MSRLRNIPQSGEEQVASTITNLGRQVRSLRSQQQRAPQATQITDATEYTVTAANTQVYSLDDITIPTRKPLLLIIWRLEAMYASGGAGSFIPYLTGDVNWPDTSPASTTLQLKGLTTLTSGYSHYSGDTASAYGLASVQAARVTPGTRSIDFTFMNAGGTPAKVKNVNVWLSVL